VRKEAIKQIRKEYEYHSTALTDNMFLLGQTAEFEDRVTKAIEAHNMVIKYQKNIEDNKHRVIQLQEELRLRNQFAKTEKRLIEEQNKYAKGSIANQLAQKGLSSEQYEQLKGILDISKQELETLRQKEKLRIKERKDTGDIVLNLLRTEDIQSVINELNDDNISAQNQINRLREISIELDIKEEKSKKDKKKANYDYIDALASEYALKVLYFENEIETNKKISEDEKRSYNERAEAMKKMYDDQIVLSGIHRKEELRLLKIYYEEQKAEAKKANEEGIINKEELHKALLEIENDYINKTGIINKKHKDRLNEINNEIANGYDVIIRKLWEYNTLLNAISQGQLDERQ